METALRILSLLLFNSLLIVAIWMCSNEYSIHITHILINACAHRVHTNNALSVMELQ